MRPREWLAFWCAKGLIRLSRLLGRGGTSLPGRIARRIAPGLLGSLGSKPEDGCVFVSGTNGKTTTARMLVEMLAEGGHKVAHNQTGANLLDGLLAGLIESADWQGRLGNVAVLETDEATVPNAAKELMPNGLVVTNFFQDQIDRFGGVHTVVELVRKGALTLPEHGFLALNADDPLAVSVGIGCHAQKHYYGMDCPVLWMDTEEEMIGDAHLCLSCGQPYTYDGITYAHLGRYSCSCGHRRPQPDVRLTEYEELDEGVRVRIDTPMGPLRATLPIIGMYNLYNLLAATTTALAMGLPLHHIEAAASHFTPAFGRMEELSLGGCSLMLALVKNTTGLEQVLRTMSSDLAARMEEQRFGVLFCINDRYADGKDLTWLNDARLETYAASSGQMSFIGCSGLRADAMTARLGRADWSFDHLHTLSNLEQALDTALAALGPGGRLWILPTYTALLEIREILARRGAARRFWQA